jgi:predicted nuclease of predicted toxin-antitoxin system
MERTRQILNDNLSAEKVNTDSYLKINVENSQKLLPLNDINKIVNASDRFNVERNRCTFYRIIGTIDSTMSNPLFNLTDNNLSNKFTWSWFNTFDFLDNSYPRDNNNLDDTDYTFPVTISNFLKEKDGWFGAYEPDKTKAALCNFYDVEPKRERFSFISDINPFGGKTQNGTPVKNWEITITYPFSSNKTHNMVKGGLLITSVQQAIVSTRNMTAIGVSCKHNLNIGDIVNITGTVGYDGEYVVVRTGLDSSDYKEYYFVIDSPFNAAKTIGSNSRFKKVIAGVESEYYFRIFKKIKTRTQPIIETDDYETFNIAFSENFFNDPYIQVVFNEDIDVKNLVDNLGRPLSEIYLTFIKTSSNNLFTQVKSGIETPYDPKLKNSNSSNLQYLRDIPSIQRIHNGGTSTPFTSHTPLESNVSISDDLFYGDIVEYNTTTLLEVVLADVNHCFNTVNRLSNPSLTYTTKVGITPPATSPTKTITLGPRLEGYFYKPHYKMKIREFSTYIEFGDRFTDNIPSYAITLPDETYAWRDLLDLGVNESDEQALDYPFLNDSHYLHQIICFNLKRQDPFGIWGLYYSKFPEDPIGDRINDKYEVKEDDDVC